MGKKYGNNEKKVKRKITLTTVQRPKSEKKSEKKEGKTGIAPYNNEMHNFKHSEYYSNVPIRAQQS